MKNKKNRITLGVIIGIVLIIVMLVVLMLIKVLPNPFLDTSDLVCIKPSYGLEYEGQKIVTIKFDKWAITNDISLKEQLEFYELYDAQSFYEVMKESIEENYQEYLSLEDKKVIINKNDYELSKEDLISRKQTKKFYEKGGYECE